MKKLPLRPYHGEIWLCRSLAELRKLYEQRTGAAYPYQDDPAGGRFIMLERDEAKDRIFLVFARTPAILAHELSHILLVMFKTIGHDPREGDGEPFCYMMSQLMIEAGHG